MIPNPYLLQALQRSSLPPVASGVMGATPTIQMAPGAPGPQTGNGYSGLGPGSLWDSIGRQKGQANPALPYFEQDRQRLGGLLTGQSPFASSNWGGLITTLEDRAAGRGPSAAGDAYRAAAQDTTNALSSMSRGSGSAAAGRQAMIQQGRVGQGMAAGYATARNQEMLGAQSALGQALAQRDSLNQNAYLDVLGKQLGLSSEQLRALLSNADRDAQKKIADKQASAAKWNAIGGGLGALGGIL